MLDKQFILKYNLFRTQHKYIYFFTSQTSEKLQSYQPNKIIINIQKPKQQL